MQIPAAMLSAQICPVASSNNKAHTLPGPVGPLGPVAVAGAALARVAGVAALDALPSHQWY
jgi:hypothetical protein